jgi:predicted PurR-regulated permease PerM
MSFNSTGKPRLVETKLSKYYLDKIKQKELKEKIALEELEKSKIELELQNYVQPVEPFHKKITGYIWNFVMDNYGFVILVLLLCILLYVRYIEVNKRKAQLKEVLEKMQNENNEDFN